MEDKLDLKFGTYTVKAHQLVDVGDVKVSRIDLQLFVKDQVGEILRQLLGLRIQKLPMIQISFGEHLEEIGSPPHPGLLLPRRILLLLSAL